MFVGSMRGLPKPFICSRTAAQKEPKLVATCLVIEVQDASSESLQSLHTPIQALNLMSLHVDAPVLYPA